MHSYGAGLSASLSEACRSFPQSIADARSAKHVRYERYKRPSLNRTPHPERLLSLQNRTEQAGGPRMPNPLDRFRLDGRVALITGGARGIGRATAEAFVAAGARAVLLDRDLA